MRVTEQTFNQIKQMRNVGVSTSKVAKLFDCSTATVSRVARASDWQEYCEFKKAWAIKSQEKKSGDEASVEQFGEPEELQLLNSPDAVLQLGRIATALEDFVKLVK